MGTKPRVVVTGVGYSGTTFVMRLARELGWDLDEANLHGRDERKGLEWEPFWKLSTEVSKYLGRVHEPVKPWWTRVLLHNPDLIRDSLKEQLNAMPFPPIVKCPDYGQSLFLDLLEPEMVIICHRNLKDIAQSMKADNIFALQNLSLQEVYDGVALAYGHLVNDVQICGLNSVIAAFPAMVLNMEYAWSVLGGPLQAPSQETFADAWGKAANPDWVHYK